MNCHWHQEKSTFEELSETNISAQGGILNNEDSHERMYNTLQSVCDQMTKSKQFVQAINDKLDAVAEEKLNLPSSEMVYRCLIYRGYYTVARRYEFYLRVARTISHEWAKRTSEILFLPREHKIHIFEPTCNVLFIIWRLNIEYFRFYCVSK